MDYCIEARSNIICVRWQDTKSVTLMSNYAGVEPRDEARCWDKSKREYFNVNRLFIVTECNTHMGGVDASDSRVAWFKFPV